MAEDNHFCNSTSNFRISRHMSAYGRERGGVGSEWERSLSGSLETPLPPISRYNELPSVIFYSKHIFFVLL